MTLLEFILTHYLGEPISREQPGESYWECPHCGGDRFHTLPSVQNFKHRAKCWTCPFRGDVFDILKEFHPDENFGDRKARLAEFKREFERAGYSSGERGVPRPTVPADKKSMALAEIVTAMLRGIDAGVIEGAIFETYPKGEKQNASHRGDKKKRSGR